MGEKPKEWLTVGLAASVRFGVSGMLDACQMCAKIRILALEGAG